MPTVIDALLVTLGLDPKAFHEGRKQVDKGLKDTREEAKKTGNEIEDIGKNGAVALRKLRNEVVAIGSALLGASGVKDFASRIVTADAAVGRLAKNVGSTSSELSAWQGVAERAGGTANGMAAAFRNLASQMETRKATGTTAMIPYLYQAQVDVAKFLDEATSNAERLLLLGDAFENKPLPQAQYWGQKMGFDEDTVNVIHRGRAAITAMLEEQNKLGVVTEQNTIQAQKLESAWASMAQSATSLGRGLLYAVVPGLEKVADVMAGLSSGAAGKWLYEFLHPAKSLPGGAAEEKAYDDKLSGSRFRPAGGRRDSNYSNEGRNFNPRRASGAVTSSASRESASALFAGLESTFGLPSGLLDAVWNQESARGQQMLSKAGAKGHFQFMDATAKQYGVKDPNDLAQSARGAAAMFRDLLSKYGGDLPKALAGYNWGQGNVDKLGMDAMKDETRNYIPSVMGSMGLRYEGGASGGSTTDVKIGSITVQTAATDADGIARDLMPAIRRHSFAMQANTGQD